MTNRSRWWAAGLAILGLGLAAYSLRPGAGMAQQAQQAQQQMACPKCMVVESEGTNLLVVDTSSNRLY
ncbi:MAG TPA: hypothetical protein VIL46_01755, partial [Gemmataceae bacterium]